jgi:hypothetical protein
MTYVLHSSVQQVQLPLLVVVEHLQEEKCRRESAASDGSFAEQYWIDIEPVVESENPGTECRREASEMKDYLDDGFDGCDRGRRVPQDTRKILGDSC